MILIFGGTTEGRKAVAVCEEAGKPFCYSTKGDSQKVELVNGKQITGGMDDKQILSFCEENKIDLIVDAAHPFAEALHHNIALVSGMSGIPVIRYERNYARQSEDLFWFDSYDGAITWLEKNNKNNLLALTGVNTVSKLKPYWKKHACWFRILDREESREIIRHEQFPADKVLYFGAKGDDTSLFRQLNPGAILIKESGDSGGFNEKVKAAQTLDIPLLVVKRPLLAPSFIPVYGENGLRKQIERLLPGFFALRTGYTTGTCATAATKAALIALLTGKEQTTIDVALPGGESVNLPVLKTTIEVGQASCSVLKDAGDDPDVTNGHEILSTVRLNTKHNEVRFLQGKGIGVVTLPGLGLAIGEPAINITPRAMMAREIADTLRNLQDELPNENTDIGVDVTISAPQGEELARKTFNPKLGITGGISIIGTSGIVKPFSSDAFVASIRREMQVAKALECEHIVINSGAKSERFIKQQYPLLAPQAFVHYGNFIGETIRIASELGFKQLTMGIMIGKAVKLAEGALDTHSRKGVMNRDFLVEVALNAGCQEKTINAIRDVNMARRLWEIVPQTESLFFSLIRQRCSDVCKPLFPNGTFDVLLVDEDGAVFK